MPAAADPNAVHWSPTRAGFVRLADFGSADHPNWPADASPISAKAHKALLEGQAQGRQIASGKDGKPILIDPPKLSALKETRA